MKLRITSPQNFITFLRKLRIIERSVLLEINNELTFSKVHTPDKAVMKYSAINNEDFFEGEIDWEFIKADRIKIGIMDVAKLIDAFKHFRSEEDIFIELNLTHLNDGDCVTTELNLVSTTLTIKIRCADLSLLAYVDDHVLDMVHSKADYIHKFKLYNSDFTSIASLCNLETDSDELLEWDVFKDKIVVRGNSFNFKLNIKEDEIEIDKETRDVSIYKNQLGFIDVETGECYIHENRMVFFSNETNTSCAIGLVTK